jgi:hypothetical protein
LRIKSSRRITVRERGSRVAVMVAAIVAVLVSVGCQKKSPEERVAEVRSRYDAQLNGWIVKEEPAATEAGESMEGEGEGSAMEEPEPAAVSGDMAQEETGQGPQPRDIILDIIVRHTAEKNLPFITLDVTQADAEHHEKATYRIKVDTSDVYRGQTAQINHVLEDIPFVEGDVFSVEVRKPIPASERGEYEEFGLDL